MKFAIRVLLFVAGLSLILEINDSGADVINPSTHPQIGANTAVLSTDDARHVLMRTGFGARPDDVLRLRGLSREEAIDGLIAGISDQPAVPMPDWVHQPLPAYHSRPYMDDEERALFNNARNNEVTQLRHWWVANMLETDSPQSDRLVLFWHDLFATSYRDLGKQSLAIARQHQVFRTHGFGSWEHLLKAMIRDAALLAYLDSGTNHKASPNENLARELMELFVLGEGNFEETTVREAARALTGHDTTRFHDLQFRLKTWAQDRGDKQLFGQRGPFDGDDLIDILLEQDAAPTFLVKRFWHAFVSDTAPSPSWLAEQAQLFRRSNLDIGTLYKNVLLSDAFWHADNRGAIIKSPVDIVIGTARTLDYPIAHWHRMPRWQKLLGMNLFSPPNVSGWTEGAAFITQGHLLNRYRVAKQLTRVPAQANKNAAEGMLGLDMQEQDMSMIATPTNHKVSIVNKASNLTAPLSESESTVPDSPLRASAVYLQRANNNHRTDNRIVEIVLNDVQTPGRKYQHVRFKVEKKPSQPLMLQLDSFSCWPDCLEFWPKCAWTDQHFKASRTIALPWAAKSDAYWSDAHDHSCQFNALSQDEKHLLSSLWFELPQILNRLKTLPRFKNKRQHWLRIINGIHDDYDRSRVSRTDTPYSEFDLGLQISESFTPLEPVNEPIQVPEPSVKNPRQLLSDLSTQKLQLHELLLPKLSGSHIPSAPSSDGVSPANQIKAVIEHPLFQLK